MVKLSIPWEKDKDKVPKAGTSFTPSFSGRPKTTPTAPSVFSSLQRFTTDYSTTPPTLPPLLKLTLSSPSFLDAVVHDGTSDNPLYVIETDDNTTKIRRTDPRGFVNVARVRWRRDAGSSRKSNNDLAGVQVAFGKGSWKPADMFLGYSYGSLLNHRKFYLPHHPHSMRWKHVGGSYYCTTESVKGPVAILEPANGTSPAQLRIHDPLFRQDHSKPQRSHFGLPLSLLDFLLVTAMLLVTPSDEWTNVTRSQRIVHPFTEPYTEPSPEAFAEQSGTPPPDTGETSSLSISLPSSPKHRRSTESLRSTSSDKSGLSATGVISPAIERWRATVAPLPPQEDEPGRRQRRGPGSSSSTNRDYAPSRATSRSSAETEAHSVPASPSTTTYYASSGQSQMRRTPFSMGSASSVSVNSHQYMSPPSRELPLPPSLPAPPTPPNQPRRSVDSVRRPPLPPPPPVPTSSPVASMHSQYASSAGVAHSRSLPVPPTPSPFMASTPGPSPIGKTSLPNAPSVPAHSLSHPRPHTPSRQHPYDQHGHTPSPLTPLSRSQSYGHLPLPTGPAPAPPLPDALAQYAYAPPPPVKAPPGYVARGESSGGRHSLTIRTSLDEAADAAGRAAEVPHGPLYDQPPPAYSAVDMARSPLRLRAVNADPGTNEP